MKKLFFVHCKPSDHQKVRDQFEGEFEVSCFLDAESCKKAIKQAKKQNEELPDVVIIDLTLPDTSGLELFKKLSKSLEDTQFILMVPREADEMLPIILKAGVVNYVLKSENYLKRVRSAIPKAKDYSLI